MGSAQQNNREVAIEMNSPTFKNVLRECYDLQKKLQAELKELVEKDPTIEANVKNLGDFLNNKQWEKLEELVQTTRTFDPPNDLSPPVPKIISYNQVEAVRPLFVNPKGKLNYLKLLIPHFKNENVPFGILRNAPIHYAVAALDEEFLEWLLRREDAKGLTLIDVNLRNRVKKTALYMLCEKYNTSNLTNVEREQIIKLIDRLLRAKADFNIYSGPNQLPFDLLLKHYESDIAIKQLIDRHEWRMKQTITAIAYSERRKSMLRPRHIKLYQEDQENTKVWVTAELLELFLQFDDLENFNQYWRTFSVDQNNVKKVIKLVLQVAVGRNLGNIVNQMVQRVGSLIFEKDEENPGLKHRFELKGLLLSAARAGNLEILKLLMALMKDDQELVNYDSLLAQTLEKAHSTRQKENETDNFLKCAKYLIKSNAVSLNKPTDSGNTPLHLAVKYGYDEIVVALLENGCGSLGVSNHAYLTPLEFGTRSFWKACFDKFIEGDGYEEDWESIDFDTNCFQSFSIDNYAKVTHTGWRKFLPIRSATQASARCHKRVVVTEMTPLRRMAESKDLKPLLTHPVIYAFLMVKLVRLSVFHLLNLLLTMVTIGSFGWYSLAVCHLVDPTLQIFFMVLSFIGSLVMAAREGLQLYLLPQSYMTLENLVDIIIIIVMNVVLWGGCNHLLSSAVVLAFSLQMVFMLSALPFKRVSTMIYMFKTVAVNFARSLFLFLPLIFAFVFAFYLTYNTVNESSVNSELNKTYVTSEIIGKSDNETEDEEDFNKFRTVMTAVVKTVVMTIGEFDAADLNLTGGKVLLFCVFLFIAPLVILNLMNGLAVSDITAIQEESELIGISKKVIELERIDHLMVSLKIEWIRNWFPKPFLKHHSSKIRVRIDELGKILVRRKQPEQPVSQQQPNTERNGANVPLLDQNCEYKSLSNQRAFSLPLFELFFSEGTDIVLDLYYFRITSFLTLDRSILAEALNVIEDRATRNRIEQNIMNESEDEMLTRISLLMTRSID